MRLADPLLRAYLAAPSARTPARQVRMALQRRHPRSRAPVARCGEGALSLDAQTSLTTPAQPDPAARLRRTASSSRSTASACGTRIATSVRASSRVQHASTAGPAAKPARLVATASQPRARTLPPRSSSNPPRQPRARIEPAARPRRRPGGQPARRKQRVSGRAQARRAEPSCASLASRSKRRSRAL